MSFYTKSIFKANKFIDLAAERNVVVTNRPAFREPDSLYQLKVNYHPSKLKAVLTYNEVRHYINGNKDAINLDKVPHDKFEDIVDRYVRATFLKKGQYVIRHGEDLPRKIKGLDSNGWAGLEGMYSSWDPLRYNYINPSILSIPTINQMYKYCINVLLHYKIS